LLLRQEPEGRDACKEIYKLSDSEAEYLVNAPVGSGYSKRGERGYDTGIQVHELPSAQIQEIYRRSCTLVR